MTPRPAPSTDDLRTRLLARLEDIRRALDQTAAAAPLSSDQRDEYNRLMDALKTLERRVTEMLAE